MSDKEKEILSSLMVVSEQYRGAPTEMSFQRSYVPRLLPFHGLELFRVITGIPGEYRDFPSAAELERVAEKICKKEKNLLDELEAF